jgi:hypothetical protein
MTLFPEEEMISTVFALFPHLLAVMSPFFAYIASYLLGTEIITNVSLGLP